MGWFSALFGGAAAQPIEAVGNVLDKLFTSDEQRLTKKAILEELYHRPALAQAEINKVAASHRSLFVAGPRPFILWICGFSLLNQFLIAPYVEFFTGVHLPTAGDRVLFDLIVALLGLGACRTVEKLAGRAK